MRSAMLIVSFTGIVVCGLSQNKWEMGFATGASNYLGEMGGKAGTRRDFMLDMKFPETKNAAGYFVRYKAKHNIYVKGSTSWNRISGADALSSNPGRRGRNLSFRNEIYEMSVTGQYAFYERYHVGKHYQLNNNFMAYVFTGIAGFYHNPQAEFNGEWVDLQPLKTEGQAKPYHLMQMAIPAGTGFFFTMKKYRVGWEINWRTTFTDYLDDVSTVYPEASELGSNLASELSNRNDELVYSKNSDLPAPQNYAAGSKRGDPTHNDSYVTTSFNIGYLIQGQSDYGKKKKGQFGKKKYIHHIIRES